MSHYKVFFEEPLRTEEINVTFVVFDSREGGSYMNEGIPSY